MSIREKEKMMGLFKGRDCDIYGTLKATKAVKVAVTTYEYTNDGSLGNETVFLDKQVDMGDRALDRLLRLIGRGLSKPVRKENAE
jgi:hypothetical protein